MAIYTSKDIRQKFNITQRQLDCLFENGKLEPVEIMSGHRIFNEFDVEKVAMALEAKAARGK